MLENNCNNEKKKLPFLHRAVSAPIELENCPEAGQMIADSKIYQH